MEWRIGTYMLWGAYRYGMADRYLYAVGSV